MEGESLSPPRPRYTNGRRFELEQVPALLLPAVAPGKRDYSVRGVNPISGDAAHFDKDWGFYKFMLDRRTGINLYLQPEVGGGDGVILLG